MLKWCTLRSIRHGLFIGLGKQFFIIKVVDKSDTCNGGFMKLGGNQMVCQILEV